MTDTNQISEYQKMERDLAAAQIEIAGLQVELDNARRDYENLFEGAGDAIFIVDPGSYKIIKTNFHAVRRFGYAPGELDGQPLSVIEVTADNGDARQVRWESSVSGTKVYECYYRNKKGDLIPVEVSSCLIRAKGNEVIQSYVRNIEVRKKMAVEQEQLIADLDSFADTVAHDLKSPLSIVLGYAYYLEEKWASLDPVEIEKMLYTFTRNTERLVNIVDELLLFASVRKQDQIIRKPINTNVIVAEAEARLARFIEESEVEIIKPDNWPGAISYAPWVEEIWANYISNAIKYGGKPPRVELGGNLEENQMVRFWVKDNGAGIDPDQLSQLFGKFDRLGEVRIEGHGLGLSIVKRIVEKLGGEVGVESTPGQGSIFSFTLPAQLRAG